MRKFPEARSLPLASLSASPCTVLISAVVSREHALIFIFAVAGVVELVPVEAALSGVADDEAVDVAAAFCGVSLVFELLQPIVRIKEPAKRIVVAERIDSSVGYDFCGPRFTRNLAVTIRLHFCHRFGYNL